MTTHEQIGTVEILAPRVYKLDMNGASDTAPTEIMVSVGTYPVYRFHDSVYWMLTGQIDNRFQRMGDGMFRMRGVDEGEGPEVTVPSRIYGPEEFEKLLTDPLCQKDSPEQRLRFHLTEAVHS